ncbi:siderophore-interacting protein [Humibacter ginsengisoli]
MGAVTSTILRVTIRVQANLRPAVRRPHHATVELRTAKGTVQRVLTPAPFREEAGSEQLLTELDVVTHRGPGEITPWVRGLRSGDELRMTLSSQRLDLPHGFARYILLADATGLPALRTLLARLPEAAEVIAYASAYYSDTPRYLGHQPCVEWLPAASTDAELADALSSHGPLSDDVFVWAAGAEHRMRLLRPLVARGPRSSSVSSITDYWSRSMGSRTTAHAS